MCAYWTRANQWRTLSGEGGGLDDVRELPGRDRVLLFRGEVGFLVSGFGFRAQDSGFLVSGSGSAV